MAPYEPSWVTFMLLMGMGSTLLMPIATLAIAVFFARLVLERIAVNKAIRQIPIRVCITGTRGKSSVTRLIGAGLRAGGLSVVTKTTGTSPMLIGPDGHQSVIPRRGRPSILEQVRLLRWASQIPAQALVFEVMSIGPETQSVETGSILAPTHLAITNVRLDHLNSGVRNTSDIARMFALSIPPEGKVFMPAGEVPSEIREACAGRRAELMEIDGAEYADLPQGLSYPEFTSNLQLALSICESLGVPPAIAYRGMLDAEKDPGALQLASIQGCIYAAAFAANDPESTLRILEKTESELGPFDNRAWILAIRPDRGERSVQWIESLKEFTRRGITLGEVIVVGDRGHGRATARLLRRAGIDAAFCSSNVPEEITRRAQASIRGKGLVMGVGNIHGVGMMLTDYWAQKHEEPA